MAQQAGNERHASTISVTQCFGYNLLAYRLDMYVVIRSALLSLEIVVQNELGGLALLQIICGSMYCLPHV